MTSGKPQNHKHKLEAAKKGGKKPSEPQWADGLRQIYDSVLDEPLPDSFNDLLAKLDDPS